MEGAIPAELLSCFKALVDEERLRIIGLLLERGYRVDELVKALRLKPAVIMRHLALLDEVGLVRAEMVDGVRQYIFAVEALQRLKRELLTREGPTVLEEVGGDLQAQRILRNFLEGERLKTIPAQRNSRLIVLAWLAERFDPDMRYMEKAVNELLKRHHPDFATLRRELVDNGFLKREGGVYWRVGRMS